MLNVMTTLVKRLRTLLLTAVPLALASPALAEEPARHPGPQAEAPGPEGPSHRTLVQDLGQRRAIRGCPVGDSCNGPIQAGLVEFERRAFPKKNAGDPWMPEDLYGHVAVRRAGRLSDRVNPEGAREGSTSVDRPSELRPDLPWLDDLKLPDVPVHWNEKIIKYLEFYRYDARGRNIMKAWLRDQNKYKKMMLKELRNKKLPDALIYISMIESSYDPHEYSRVGASGLWQFMPAAGKIYGLSQGRWLDERNDPELSTIAVTDYFQDLYDRFGSWDLAMAAFNAGYGAVIKSIAKYNSNDYWQLISYENGLPWGTSNYVAKWLATAIVGHNLETFGFADITLADEIETDLVSVPKSVALSIVARAAGTKKETIEHLNPQLRRGRTPPGVKDYKLRVPKGAKQGFAEKFAQMRADWDDVDAYVVKHGERFEDIATTYGISRSKLRKLNGLESESEVRGGMILVVPKVDEAKKIANRAKAQENLYKSGVPAADDGEALLIPVADAEFRVANRRRWFYRVVSGDTQSSIAEAFSVDRFDLASWNGLDPEAHLHPRMIVQVWTRNSFKPESKEIAVLDPNRIKVVEAGSQEHLDEAERRIGRKRRSYSPKRPESFETIGKKFGLGKYDLARINQRASDTIVSPGESILVYEVVDASESDRAAAQAKAARKAQGKGKKGRRK